MRDILGVGVRLRSKIRRSQHEQCIYQLGVVANLARERNDAMRGVDCLGKLARFDQRFGKQELTGTASRDRQRVLSLEKLPRFGRHGRRAHGASS